MNISYYIEEELRKYQEVIDLQLLELKNQISPHELELLPARISYAKSRIQCLKKRCVIDFKLEFDKIQILKKEKSQNIIWYEKAEKLLIGQFEKTLQTIQDIWKRLISKHVPVFC